MLTTRRALLGATALAVPAALLAGCATVPVIAQQVADDVHLVATALQAALPGLKSLLGSATPTISTISAKVDDAVQAAAGVIGGMAVNAAKPIVQQIGDDWQAVRTALSGFTLPATLQDVVDAITVLLPVAQVAVGIAVAAAAPSHAMTPDQARAVLRAAGGHT